VTAVGDNCRVAGTGAGLGGGDVIHLSMPDEFCHKESRSLFAMSLIRFLSAGRKTIPIRSLVA
jgi:hypothetical protein